MPKPLFAITIPGTDALIPMQSDDEANDFIAIYNATFRARAAEPPPLRVPTPAVKIQWPYDAAAHQAAIDSPETISTLRADCALDIAERGASPEPVLDEPPAAETPAIEAP